MKAVLVTGGTGSFGQAFIRELLSRDIGDVRVDAELEFLPGEGALERVVVFSRDELKQHDMRTGGFTDDRLRWFIGDVRDRDRLRRAMQGIDTVVHAAALKQVDTCEFNPLEAVKTNVDGTANVINAALDSGVRKVLMLSSDKAVDPVNLYGATKLVAEKLIVDANAYSGKDGPRFAATRYGNVISSRGSVLPLFQAQHARGEPLTVTDPSMTRFILTLNQGVDFVTRALDSMAGGEVFVPKLPAVTVGTIGFAVTERSDLHMAFYINEVGLRPGEKMHELLVSQNEASRTVDAGWCYIVKPIADLGLTVVGVPVEAGFRFGSDTAERLDVDGFRRLAGLASAAEVPPPGPPRNVSVWR